MNHLLPSSEATHTVTFRVSNFIYWLIIGLLTACFVSLYLIRIEVGVTAAGALRPDGDKFSIRSGVSGNIDSIYFKEGDIVKSDQVIFSIDNVTYRSKITAIETELKQKTILRQDLVLICKSDLKSQNSLSSIASPVYNMQLGDYFYQANARNTGLQKSEYELLVAGKLFKDSVISKNEYFKFRNDNSRLRSEYEAFRLSRKSAWERELITLNSEIAELEKQHQGMIEENNQNMIRAPSTGTLMGINDKHPGSFIQAGEAFGELSPETNLIAECLISPSDIGIIKNGQKVTMQIDAFDHSYFGSVNGYVSSIDNDYTIIRQAPVYKVRCSIDENSLRLKNGYEAKLKKGLTFQARFIVAKRSAFELMFDNIDDWLNPMRI